MRGWLIWVICCLCLSIVTGSLWMQRAADLEREGHYSMGIYGERNLFSLTEGETHKEYRAILSEENVADGIASQETGVYTRIFTYEEGAPECMMRALGFETAEEMCSFFTDVPLVSLDAPMTWEDLAVYFYVILSLSTEDAPFDGRLERFTIASKVDELIVYAEADVSFLRFVKKYHLGFLPERARVSILIPYAIKNAELCADYDGIFIRLDDCDLPEMVLSCVLEDVIGQSDCRDFLATAVGNVIVNACF